MAASAPGNRCRWACPSSPSSARALGAGGGRIVKAVGLDDWVAEDDEGYIAIAKRFAAASAALAALGQLPARIAASAAGNGVLYTRHVEAAYRQFWREYCAAQAS